MKKIVRMKDIDVNRWRMFRISDIFDMDNTNSISSRDVAKDSGSHPYLTASAANNAVSSFIDYKPELLERGNCIFVGGKTLVITYQPKDFYSNDSHNLAFRLKEKANATEDVLLFFVTVLRKTLEQKYQWSDSISMKAIKRDEPEICIPTTSDGLPDYAYMASLTSTLRKKAKKSLAIKQAICKSPKKKISVSKWGTFGISDFFVIDAGTKLDKVKMKTDNPQVNFVGRSNLNNGIACAVDRIKGLKPYPSGALTLALGGSIGSCFVQPKPFYTSQNVNVLIPKQEMSWYVKQFIATCIFKESQLNYKAFVKELNAHVKTDFRFKLPITADNQPDFAYMEKTMRMLYANVGKHFALLNEVVE